MTNQTQQPQPIQQPASQPATTPVQNTSSSQEFMETIKSICASIFNKLYSNKMIFWSVISFFGIVLLIVITGLLFGRKRQPTVINTHPTVTPFVLSTPAANTNNDVISTSQEKLFKLKNQLNLLDLKQERLSPPEVNFDVRF